MKRYSINGWGIEGDHSVNDFEDEDGEWVKASDVGIKDKVEFSFRDENGEAQHATVGIEGAACLIADLFDYYYRTQNFFKDVEKLKKIEL